jgi:hypothetical protein
MRLDAKSKTRRSPSRRGKLCGLLLLPTLTACQTTTPLDGTDATQGASFCEAARAIYYSKHDTPPTIAQIKEHNAVGMALKCGWLPANKQKVSK